MKAVNTHLSLIFSVLLFYTIISISFSQDNNVPVATQLPLFLKILSFDRNLVEKAGNNIRIGILYQEKYELSRSTRNELLTELEKYKNFKLQGLDLKWTSIDLEKNDLAQTLSNQEIDILYITPLRAFDINDITTVSRQLGKSTLSGVSDYIQRGVSIGIDIKGGKPEILINLKAAKNENADFSSQLLKLARIY